MMSIFRRERGHLGLMSLLTTRKAPSIPTLKSQTRRMTRMRMVQTDKKMNVRRQKRTLSQGKMGPQVVKLNSLKSNSP